MSDTSQFQKIASAIYLVTSFFLDQEPLKWKLRTLATDFASESVKDKPRVAREVSWLFNVAKNAGLISEPNHQIFLRELARIESELNRPVELNLPLTQALKQPDSTRTLPEPIKDKSSEGKPSLREFGAVSVKKNNRQSIIIGLLKRKKEIMIKDVSPLIQGCSEKTIQRELSQMVQGGILAKIGSKRWTKYSLAGT